MRAEEGRALQTKTAVGKKSETTEGGKTRLIANVLTSPVIAVVNVSEWRGFALVTS